MSPDIPASRRTSTLSPWLAAGGRPARLLQPNIQYVEGFESVSNIGNVGAEMERRGYTAEEIAQVFGANWMRVFSEAWNS